MKQLPLKNSTINWISSDNMAGSIPAFEENKGQFPATAKGWKILYGCNYQGMEILLTDKGIIYNVAKGEKSEKDSSAKEIDFDRDPQEFKIRYQHIFINWENATANPIVEAQDEIPSYFCEGKPEHPDESITHIKGFQKIVYHELYPGVDLEFSFHKEKGIEYAVRIKPGFDAGVFKMKYTGASGLSLDSAHNLHIGTVVGDIIDYAPITANGGNKIASSFQKTGNDEISFNMDHSLLNASEEVLIDPWTIFPISPTVYASDISIDANNNTYVLEYTLNKNILFYILLYVQKYNAAGALQWTYALNEFTPTPSNPVETDSTKSYAFGLSGFATDENGNSYIAAPFGFSNKFGSRFPYGMVCLNTLGQRNYLDYTYNGNSIYETWNIAYSCNDNILVEAGEGPACCNAAQFDGVDMATGNPYPGGYVNANGGPSATVGEIYAGTIAPNGNYYALSTQAVGGYQSSFFSGQLLCGSVTHSGASLLWQVPVSYAFGDGSTKCTPYQIGTNGIAAGCAYLYTSNGLVLEQRNLTNGSVIGTTNIPGGSDYSFAGLSQNFFYNSPLTNSGIAVDPECGNVYVGSYKAIYVYDESLHPIGSFTGFPGWVSDVKYYNGIISACGNDSLGFTSFSSFAAQMNALPCASGLVITHTYNCEENMGTATATPSFCPGPYSYSWSPSGQTTQTATGLSAGTYVVNITPNSGCFTITDVVTIKDSAYTVMACCDATITKGGTASLTIDTVQNCKWVPSTGLNCDTCPNAIATPTVTTSYTVTGTDKNGCPFERTVLITVDVSCGEVFVPNVFAPDETTHNNILYVRGPCIASMDFLVFDRWGNKVFETKNQNTGWDGTYKGQAMNPATYIWYLKATMQDGTSMEKKGNVTLVR